MTTTPDIELIREAARIFSFLPTTQKNAQDLRAIADRMEAQGKQEPVAENVITGACYDLMGYLTTRRTRLCVSDHDDAGEAVSALVDWFKLRGLKGEEALVENWQDYAHPAPIAQDELEAPCKWETGELGRSMEHAQKAPAELQARIDAALSQPVKENQ